MLQALLIVCSVNGSDSITSQNIKAMKASLYHVFPQLREFNAAFEQIFNAAQFQPRPLDRLQRAFMDLNPTPYVAVDYIEQQFHDQSGNPYPLQYFLTTVVNRLIAHKLDLSPSSFEELDSNIRAASSETSTQALLRLQALIQGQKRKTEQEEDHDMRARRGHQANEFIDPEQMSSLFSSLSINQQSLPANGVREANGIIKADE